MKKRHFLLTALLVTLMAYTEAANRVSQSTRAKLNRELPILGLAVGDPVLIRTFKEESRLELWIKPQSEAQYLLFRTYPICAHSGGLGPKLRVGDKMTPEGFYRIIPSALQPNSRYHLAINIGYPNAYDRYHGRTGSLLMIHGACDSIGCFAMSNQQIEEIYYLVEQAFANGQSHVPVHAFPFHLTDEKMSAHGNSHWSAFWQELKAGYDLFNHEQVPPVITNASGHYLVDSGQGQSSKK